MHLLTIFCIAFIASIGFAIVFQSPRDIVLQSGLVGAFAWVFYIVANNQWGMQPIFSNLLASILVGILSEILARIYKKPVTCFIVPGIIVLVPGAGIFYTMEHFLKNEVTLGLNTGIETLFVAVSLSVGILFVSSIARVLKNRKKYQKLPLNTLDEQEEEDEIFRGRRFPSE